MTGPDAERVAMVALARACAAHGISDAELTAALSRAGSARAVLAGAGSAFAGDGRLRAAACHAFPGERLAERLAAWTAAGLCLSTVLDVGYPASLRTVTDHPPLVWYRGGVAPTARGFAIVGTRSPSPEGRVEARAFATAMAQAGFTVVSGLARGIDTEAHRAALAAGARTVAVLAHGLAHPTYPPENAALAEAIAAHGALISQWDPEEPCAPARFRARNAVIAALGAGSLVIEAGVRSGARLEARLAAEQRRPVYLTRRLVEREAWARLFVSGYGAVVVDGPDDLLAHIRRSRPIDPDHQRQANERQLRFDDPPTR